MPNHPVELDVLRDLMLGGRHCRSTVTRFAERTFCASRNVGAGVGNS